MASAVLPETLAVIASEHGGRFHRSFDLVDRLLAEYGEENLAERLYADIPTDCPWQVVADLFGILIWSTSDNGAAITRTTESWLQAGEDLRRIQVALYLDVYPFKDAGEMERILVQVAAKYPEAAEQCARLVISRRKLGEQSVDGGGKPQLTDDLKVELDRRLAAYQADPDNVLTWEQVEAQARRPR
jgi:putative addiction module component (TIGR02574 family)